MLNDTTILNTPLENPSKTEPSTPKTKTIFACGLSWLNETNSDHFPNMSRAKIYAFYSVICVLVMDFNDFRCFCVNTKWCKQKLIKNQKFYFLSFSDVPLHHKKSKFSWISTYCRYFDSVFDGLSNGVFKLYTTFTILALTPSGYERLWAKLYMMYVHTEWA